MPLDQSAQVEPIVSFEKGMDQESSPTMMLKGTYELAQNMLLGVDGARKYLASCKVDTALDSGAAWPSGNTIWLASYTMHTISGSVITETTHLIFAQDTGAVYRYDAGSPGTVTLVRRGFTASADLWTTPSENFPVW